jgi:DNA-binding winged helix-turn-helix (wHTH) protein/tetratricopeptide (TPR) repeat protein
VRDTPTPFHAASPLSEGLAFGDFVLEPLRRKVSRRDGTPVELTPRVFNVLQLFVERPGQLITKDTLMRELWPDQVVGENSLSQLIHALRRALGDDGERHRYIQTEARRGFRLVVPVEDRPEAPGGVDRAALVHTPRSTLAVLPFVALTSQPDLVLLEVGMADSVTARLSTVPGLVLRSVGSVRRFAGPERELGQAALALDVAWLLDGTLQLADGQLRVSARLLAMPGGMAAWSASYNAAFTHVFDVQDLIAERVAQALAAPLGGQAPWAPSLAAARLGGTRNIDAYQLYLAAQQHAQGIRADGLARSIELYLEALAIDECYALAHVGIAESCRRMVMGADRDPREALDVPRAHVQRALAMAPDLAEAHALMGWIHWWFDFDWARAELAFRRALALNANVANAHFGLAHMLLATLGRVEEGLAHARMACELDPLSLLYASLEATFLAAHGDVATARARLDRVLQIEPRFWIAHGQIGAIALKAGRLDDAIEALRRADALADGSTQMAAVLGVALARAGKLDEARAVLQRLQALAGERYVPPTSLAAVHASLGETVHALDALERAYERRDPRLTFLRNDYRWRALHGQPRFEALIEKLQLHLCPPGLSPL